MTATGWLLFIVLIQLIHFLGTWKLYKAAGRNVWEAAVPVYNAIVLLKIINRPPWWTLLLFIPIVNLIMFPVIWVETIRSFGFNTGKDTALVVLTGGLYIFYLAYTQELKYKEDRSLKPRTSTGEWVSSILFAVVAATIVHTYFMQPFTIPTSSLEKTLLVGDYLFVSKFHYGARAPMTPLSFPMVHDTIPGVGKKSYIKSPQAPYLRFPGFQSIKHNDIVVFSWPTDTLVNIYNPLGGTDYKPIDKKSNYVKRCVGLPGDSLEIKNGFVYINGEKNILPGRAKLQFAYAFTTKKPFRNFQYLSERFDITDVYPRNRELTAFVAHMTDEAYEKFKNFPEVDKIILLKDNQNSADPSIFPQDPNYAWNTNNFGPIYIPQQGATVAITPSTIPFYKRIIEVYEGSELGLTNKITISGTQVLLNGSPITSYTFKMDYYWMMGDNRNNSQDARMWGYVPFNHIVGKPVFVWMSIDSNAKGIMNKIRWDRVFTTVGGDGKPVSYFRYFLIALAGWFIFDFFRKKKKASKA